MYIRPVVYKACSIYNPKLILIVEKIVEFNSRVYYCRYYMPTVKYYFLLFDGLERFYMYFVVTRADLLVIVCLLFSWV
jgi:hypothetical protein